MAKTNLSLGNLYRATQGSARTTQAVSLNAMNASAGTAASLAGFAVDSVTVNLPTFTYIVEDTSENGTFSFGSAGALHGTRVGSVAANYVVSFDNSNFTIPSSSLGASPSFNLKSALVANPTSYSEAESTLSMKYADGYNLNATNYNVASTKKLYAVDVYNTINQPDFCLLFGTEITKTDGTKVNVEDLSVGDTIKAWVPDGLPDENQDSESDQVDWRFHMVEEVSGSYQEVTVADIVFNFASGYYSVNDGLIKGTGTHPLYTWDSEIQKYKFKTLEDLLPGDLIVTYNEVDGVSEVEVYDIQTIIEDVEIVTLNVENADVYIANGTISHNKGTTTQPYIPSTGLRLYVDPSKAASTSGTTTADWLDLSGYGAGVRPAGVANAAGITGGNPSYNAGGTRKEKYFAGNGTNQFWYKDKDTNINGAISQFNTNTGTIHMWIRPTTTLGVASRHIFDYAGFYGLAIESTDSSTLNRVKFYGSTLGNSAQLSTSLSANTWYMISVTFQPSGTCTLYVDGSSVGTFSSSAFTAPSSTNFLTIGSNSARTTFWNGQIGPVLFYNTLQTSTLVTQTYNYFSPTYK
jgi:hypothetical protein